MTQIFLFALGLLICGCFCVFHLVRYIITEFSEPTVLSNTDARKLFVTLSNLLTWDFSNTISNVLKWNYKIFAMPFMLESH